MIGHFAPAVKRHWHLQSKEKSAGVKDVYTGRTHPSRTNYRMPVNMDRDSRSGGGVVRARTMSEDTVVVGHAGKAF
jgi:hypothetical protein